MIIRTRSTRGYKLHGLDGDVGGVDEFCFDDEHWTVRYLVADTGGWLDDRQVLISPLALGPVDRTARKIAVKLTRKQIEDSPLLETDRPVSRQFEASYHLHYGWPTYWDYPYNWQNLNMGMMDYLQQTESVGSKKEGDPHLCSTRDLSGYGIHAKDGELGCVDDFLIDDTTWTIRYLVLDTGNWWPGKRILVSPAWIHKIDWDRQEVRVDLDLDTIRNAPEYEHTAELTREYETELHRYYQRKGYWEDGERNGQPRE